MLLMRYVLVISICLNYNSSLILENLVGKVLFVTPLWGLFRISFNLSNCTKFPRKLIFRFSKHLSLIEKWEDIWNKNIKLKLPRFCKKKTIPAPKKLLKCTVETKFVDWSLLSESNSRAGHLTLLLCTSFKYVSSYLIWKTLV